MAVGLLKVALAPIAFGTAAGVQLAARFQTIVVPDVVLKVWAEELLCIRKKAQTMTKDTVARRPKLSRCCRAEFSDAARPTALNECPKDDPFHGRRGDKV